MNGNGYFMGFTNKIIKNRNEINTILNWIDKAPTKKIKQVKLLYTPTLDKNSWKDFHNACDGKAPTIVLCEEEIKGKRFGGYTTVSWDLSNKQYNDRNAFVFSLDTYKKYTGNNTGIHCGENYGPVFLGPTLGLICNTNGEFIGPNKSSHFTLSTNYFDVPKNELSGADKFNLKNMEVYQVVFEELGANFMGFTDKIIKNTNEINTLLNWIDKPNKKIRQVKLLYTPTLEKNSWKDFHNACDGKGPTIVLCEEEKKGKRFGGYTTVSWDLNGGHGDSGAFVFSLDTNKKYTGKNPGIQCGVNYGPHFWGPTLGLIWGVDGKFIGPNQSPHATHSTNYFDVPKNELSGGDTFVLKIMEVYQVIFEEIDK